MNWTVWEQGIHLPERLIYLSDVEIKKLRLISQKGFKGKAFPLKTSRLEETAVGSEEVIFGNGSGNEKIYKYEGTNIGHAYDSLYWSWVRLIGYYRDKEEEERFDEKIKEARAIQKS